MPNLTPERFREWKENPVTLAVLDQIRNRITESKDILAGDNDREFDIYIKGMIRAFNEVLEVDLDITTETQEDEV